MSHDFDASAALLEQVNHALNSATPLRIQGSGSKAHLGRVTTGEVLDTRLHRGIVSYDPTELVLTARAGTPLAEIEAALEANNQMLPCEPPHLGDGATLGGMVAAGLSGPRRPWAGSVRDQVLGTRVSGREQPPDGKIPRFVHIDKAVEHTVRQEAKEGESVSITVTSRSSGHAERLREHIDDRFRQSGDERNPPEVRVQPPQDTGNAPEESRPSESTEQA